MIYHNEIAEFNDAVIGKALQSLYGIASYREKVFSGLASSIDCNENILINFASELTGFPACDMATLQKEYHKYFYNKLMQILMEVAQ